MKISINRQSNKVNIKLIREDSVVEFLSTVAACEALIKKLENVMSEIDGKNRNKLDTDFGDLFGNLWTKTKK